MSSPAEKLYTDGEYARSHPDWHLPDASAKARDLKPALAELLNRVPEKHLRLADVGAGVGGVLYEVASAIRGLDSALTLSLVGFEISQQAVEVAARLFPDLPIKCKFLGPTDGPFDAILLVDVLEHVENPWELLRNARLASRHLLVRQPLLESFSTFRHDNYVQQRKQWGHISFFSYRSFLDMAAATGWVPVKIDLLAPWELATSTGPGGLIQRITCRWNRVIASYFIAGFYLNGLFEAC